MTQQKLSYSGNECNNYLYFAFDAEFFDIDTVTKELNLEPTSIMIKKEPTPKSTSWKYRIDAGNDINLETYLRKLIDIFENKVDEINSLKQRLKVETRLQFVIDIDINPNSSKPLLAMP